MSKDEAKFIKDGILEKKSPSMLGAWQARTFRLHPSEILYSETKAWNPKDKQRIDLKKIKKKVQPTAKGNGVEFEISVDLAQGPTQRNYLLRAKSKEEAANWIEAINGARESVNELQASTQSSKSTSAQKSENDAQEDFRDAYEIGNKLGQGGYGTVYKCSGVTDKKSYAVKVLEDDPSRSDELFDCIWQGFLNELKMLKALDSPHIIKMYDVFEDDYFCYIVLDLMAADLLDAINNVRDKSEAADDELIFSPAKLVKIFQHMMKSIQYLQSQTVIHRDVKIENFLVDSADLSKPDFRVVLTDMNTAKFLAEGQTLKEAVGTNLYWAPEMVLGRYSHPVDVWAVGVTFYAICTQELPFGDVDEILGEPIDFPDELPATLNQLLAGVLTKVPVKRLTPAQALEHHWVQANEQEGKLDWLTKAKSRKSANLLKGGARAKIPTAVVKRREQRMKDLQADYAKGIKRAVKVWSKPPKLKHQSSVIENVPELFISEDARGGVHTWEWWDEALCIREGIVDENEEREDEATMSSLMENLTAAYLPWSLSGAQDFLAKHKIDASSWGEGKTNTVSQLSQELLRGECQLMEGNNKAVRVFEVVVLRFKSDTGKFLVETKMKKVDGRERTKPRLPGVLRRPHEDFLTTAKRCAKGELALPMNQIEFDFSSDEHLEIEADSASYPGLPSILQKHFVDVKIKSQDPELLGQIGLPNEQDFSRPITKSNGIEERTWSWWTKDQCKEAGPSVAFEGDKKADLSGKWKRKEASWTLESLTEMLKSKGVPVEEYGKGEAKSVQAFLDELTRGTSYIMQSENGSILRMVDVAAVRLRDGDNFLVETKQWLPDGRQRERNNLLGSKCKPFENGMQAAIRVLQEVSINPEIVDLTVGKIEYFKKEGKSYPGVLAVYRRQEILAEVLPGFEVRLASHGGRVTTAPPRRTAAQRRGSC